MEGGGGDKRMKGFCSLHDVDIEFSLKGWNGGKKLQTCAVYELERD